MSSELLVSQIYLQCYLGFWIGIISCFFTYNLIKFLLAFELTTINLLGMMLVTDSDTDSILFAMLSLSAVETVLILGLFVSNFESSENLDEMAGVSG